MAKLWGQTYTRQEILRRVGDMSQVASATPFELVDGNQRGVRFQPKDGMLLRAQGLISVYEKSGQYQMIVRALEAAGQGALQAAFVGSEPRISVPMPISSTMRFFAIARLRLSAWASENPASVEVILIACSWNRITPYVSFKIGSRSA